MPELLRVENLTKIYTIGTSEIYALRNVTFSVEKNEFVSIVGVSGSGKTTLLNILATLDTPTSGDVFIGGKSISKMNEHDKVRYRRTQVGIIFQFFNLIPVLTAYENVMLPMLLAGKKKNERALELLSLVGLKEKAHRYPDELSGGEQQRVAIARALANEPQLLLADEPTGNLDSRNAKTVVELLSSLAHNNLSTVIMVTHDMQIAENSDRILFLRDGILTGEKKIC